eukprot:21416-Heterococcus_DN1.PRE.3
MHMLGTFTCRLRFYKPFKGSAAAAAHCESKKAFTSAQVTQHKIEHVGLEKWVSLICCHLLLSSSVHHAQSLSTKIDIEVGKLDARWPHEGTATAAAAAAAAQQSSSTHQQQQQQQAQQLCWCDLARSSKHFAAVVMYQS